MYVVSPDIHINSDNNATNLGNKLNNDTKRHLVCVREKNPGRQRRKNGEGEGREGEGEGGERGREKQKRDRERDENKGRERERKREIYNHGTHDRIVKALTYLEDLRAAGEKAAVVLHQRVPGAPL